MANVKNCQKLIFVYNADSGISNALLDYGKKYLQPDQYDCQLCMVTFGAFGMKSDWKKYFKTLGVETEFLHRDEYATVYPNSTIQDFPVMIALKPNDEQEVLINSKKFKQIRSLDGLKTTISDL